MPTLAELHEMHLRQLDAVLTESELLLQREGGLDGELKTSGSVCENFVRTTLNRFIVPSHFRITTGFIASPSLLRNKRNLPQCDVIIVDSTTPPILRFASSNIEVVAREAVVGIIEVKRTLTPTSLCDALTQINSIIDALGERSSIKVDRELNRFNRHVGFHNFSSNQPMLAVVGLRHQKLHFERDVPNLIRESDRPVDFVWALDGAAVVPAFNLPKGINFYTNTARPAAGAWQNIDKDMFSESASEFYKIWAGYPPIWSHLTEQAGCDRAKVFATIVGIATLMLSRVFGTTLKEEQVNDYFLRA